MKLRLLTVGNRGAPGSTLRRLRGQKAWAGHKRGALEPAREQKQGRRIMHPETRFLHQENLAIRKGEPPEKRMPMRAFSPDEGEVAQ